MRAALWISGAILIFCAVSFGAQAKDVRLCYDDWPPYAYDDQGVARGLAVDLATEFLENAGHSVSFVAMPMARCRFSLRQGAVDGVLLDDLAKADETGLVISSQSLVSKVTVAVVNSGFCLGTYQGVRSLDNTNWLKVIGQSYPAEILANETMHPVEVAEYAKGFEMLKRHHVDVLFSDLAFLRFAGGDQKSLTGFKVLLPAVEIEERYLSLRSDLAPVLNDFDREMARGLLTGVVDGIYHRHLGFSRVGFARYVGLSDVPIANPGGLIVQ
ncbi:substrate-binding periplasmic protein [Thalassospira xiamenensis]|uniref:substrate-binding periplasmic protein n=1 Tax=Thalassospira xiamenensis TaxID=220697 RepID=UPI0015EFE4A4|nr:transporter substrate-binding domain-containing protein [Thalassospira xiamenensis]